MKSNQENGASTPSTCGSMFYSSGLRSGFTRNQLHSECNHSEESRADKAEVPGWDTRTKVLFLEYGFQASVFSARRGAVFRIQSSLGVFRRICLN